MNAASQMPTSLPGAAIARGARLEIAGVRLGGPGTVQVRIGREGHFVLAPVRRAEPRVIEATLPKSALLGSNSLVVETGAGPSKPISFEVASTRIGLFSVNRKGWGQGQIDLLGSERRTSNSVNAPARPGQLVAISSTGLGNGRGLRMVLGGQVAPVAGIQRNVEPDVDQILFRIPRTGPLGCYVPLYAMVPGSPPSNVVTASIASNDSSCRMPGSDASAPMQGRHIGVIGIGRTQMLYADDRPRTTLDEAYGAFLDSSQPGKESSPLLLVPPEGTCTAYTGSYESGVPNFRSFPDAMLGLLEGRGLNTGRVLRLTGARQEQVVPATGPGAYWVRLGIEEPGLRLNRPLFLEGPAYSLSSAGGEDVGPFERRLSPVGAFEWRNEAEAAMVQRSRGISIQWGKVAAVNLVLIFAVSTDPLTTATAIAFCSARPEAGRVRLPPEVMAHFPETQDVPGPPSALLFVIAAQLNPSLGRGVRGLDEFWTIRSFTRGRKLEYR